MPLVSIGEELRRAQQGKYALPLYDTEDSLSTDGMFESLDEKQAPAMIAMYSGSMERANAPGLAAYIRARAKDSRVPVSFMLDHGTSFEQCMLALHYGCTDVMFDGSRLSYEENVAITTMVVRASHAMGACVEAELGHVGQGSEYQSFGAKREGFTDPESVADFVSRTGVDFLAIAIGTAHGLYDGEVHLDVDLLREIRECVDIPLVLHGGSGCSDEQFREVIAAGICKVNVATDLFVTTGRRMSERAAVEPASYGEFSRTAIDSFKERVGHYLDVFGASGKAPA